MNFSEKRAAQVAAFFIFQAGGQIEILKLMKLMYLAERQSFVRLGEPMTGDTLYSMEHGPILSSTLNHINNFIESGPDGWDSWISDRSNREVALRIDDPIPKLKQLSDADLDILQDIWGQFGKMTAGQLRNYTHDNCGEWEDPNQSSTLIPYRRLFRCLGFDVDVSDELNERLNNQRVLETIFDQAVG